MNCHTNLEMCFESRHIIIQLIAAILLLDNFGASTMPSRQHRKYLYNYNSYSHNEEL